jgi:hypothetical protein
VRLAAIAIDERLELVEIQDGEAARPIERRSPPLPLTAITRDGFPVSGSGSSNFELVLPPPKLVIRRSSPSRFER